MHDDDFDRQRGRRDIAGVDVDVAEPARVPGKRTLVEAGLDRRRRGPATPGKRTLVDQLDAQDAVQASMGDPVTETEFQVRKAREIIAKLAAHPPPAQERELKADLRRHLEYATAAAPHALSRPGGRESAISVFQLIAEAQPYMRPTSTAEAPNKKPAGSDTVGIAERGIAGPGERLPHHDVVQRLFGAHDLSGVRAHIGGTAADASRELGAHAYAHGTDIAFAEQPTAALVAHEATHVIQQRAGVSLKSIDGGASDAHEQQADEVADAVGRGESAEKLLDKQAGGAPAVQRKEGDAPPPLPHDKFSSKADRELSKAENAGESITAPAFVHLHIADLRQDIDSSCSRVASRPVFRMSCSCLTSGRS